MEKDHFKVLNIENGEISKSDQDDLNQLKRKITYNVGGFAIALSMSVAVDLASLAGGVYGMFSGNTEMLNATGITGALGLIATGISVYALVRNLKALIEVISKESFIDMVKGAELNGETIKKYIDQRVDQKVTEIMNQRNGAPNTFNVPYDNETVKQGGHSK